MSVRALWMVLIALPLSGCLGASDGEAPDNGTGPPDEEQCLVETRWLGPQGWTRDNVTEPVTISWGLNMPAGPVDEVLIPFVDSVPGGYWSVNATVFVTSEHGTTDHVTPDGFARVAFFRVAILRYTVPLEPGDLRAASVVILSPNGSGEELSEPMEATTTFTSDGTGQVYDFAIVSRPDVTWPHLGHPSVSRLVFTYCDSED